IIFIFFILLIPTTIIGLLSYSEARLGLEYLAKVQMNVQVKNVVDKIRSNLEFVIRSNPDIITNEDVLSGLIEDDVAKFHVSEKSYVFIINHKGRVLLHPKREKKLKRDNFLKSDYPKLREIAEKMIKSDMGFGTFENEDGSMYISYLQYNKGDVLSGSSLIEPKYKLNWSIGIVMPQREVLYAAKKILRIFLITLLLSLFVFTLLGFFLMKVVILNNIDKIVLGMNKISDNIDNVLVELKSKDELGYMSKVFNDMVLELKASREKLIVQEKLKQEIELAAKIQTCLLPVIKQSKIYDISAKMLPADNVGGDYYDFVNVTESRIWIGIGDVSGHGLTPGLIMMMAQTAFNTILLSNPEISSKDLIIQANRVIYNNVKERMKEDNFMTLSFLSADKDGVITVAGAHLDILVYRSNDGSVEKIPTSGLWIGLLPEIGDKINENTFKLEKDDVMLLYT
ncbi:MAG TPA: SpoIIE family protein phosphatase, partial [Spirochaetota bacterium]|nr:SpoIIE family protein phosphatase [Spirochaetota bacterium]